MSNSPPNSPFQQFMIKHAAKDGLLVFCRCNRCREQEIYWAADLLAIGAGETPMKEFGRWCGTCQSYEFTRTWTHHPNTSDIAQFEVNRPAGVKRTQLWAKEWLELPRPELGEDAVLVKPPDRRRRY